MSPNSRDPLSFLQLIRKSERGKLKVYLGYAPGVGKTYQMLQEGHRLKAEGVDVVVGLVETHGRKETAALIAGLEVIPRRKIEYRGITLEEMDLEAILARKPQVALVDELAHTNPPASRNAKRYMDVQDLLAAGIHVVSTMNVQHLESLYNTVEGLVNVRVSERLPDTILREADQIVNVDIPPEDLQKRLKAGHVYPAERVQTALENYFLANNLEELRELTLREAATQIDYKRRGLVEESDKIPPDQILVCLSAYGPNNAHLLRYGSRLAGRLNRRWYAVNVQTKGESATKIDAAAQRELSDTLTLANQLGAMVFTFKGEDVVETILRFAREYRVGHIVIGRSDKLSSWERMLGKRDTVERLIERGRGFRIVVVDEQMPLPDTMQVPAFVSETSPAIAQGHSLPDLFTADRVIVWNAPVTKATALRDLVTAITKADSRISFEAALRAVQDRENQMSTFLNEGVAVPHAAMDDLPEIAVAFGLAHGGISDAETEQPVEAVFMALYPGRLSAQYLRAMAQVISALRDRQVRSQLATAADSEAAIRALQPSTSGRPI